MPLKEQALHQFQLGFLAAQSRPQREMDKRERWQSSGNFTWEGHLIISLQLFYLGRRVAPTCPSWAVSAEGWPRSHGHRLTLLFMARAHLTAAPEMGNIAHLAGLLGAVMPQRPALWQAINVPREKQRESDWLVLQKKVDLLPTPHWGMLWWMLSGGGERHWKGEEGILLCITPVLDIPLVTQDGGPLLPARAAGGCEAVEELSSRYTSALCHPTGRQMGGRPCHMLPFTKFPLDTMHAQRISHFKG